MIANLRWTQGLREASAKGERAVLVVVAAAAGSTPREAGAAMVVTAKRTAGTVGGGRLEFEAIRLAREALASVGAQSAWAVRFPLAARLGQCCGGVATLVFVEAGDASDGWRETVERHERALLPCVVATRLGPGTPAAARFVVAQDAQHGSLGNAELDAAVAAEARTRLAQAAGATGLVEMHGASVLLHVLRPAAFPVAVFGNGHVGRALVQVLGALPADVTWIDTREHDFPAGVPGNVAILATDDPAAEVADLPYGAYLVVMTHSHALDFAIVEAALAREDWRYVGLIGSGAKRTQFEHRLQRRGRPREWLARVTCPIGARLASKEPGVIAVGVAAELLQVRERAAEVQPHEKGAIAATAEIGARMRALRPRPDFDPDPH